VRTPAAIDCFFYRIAAIGAAVARLVV